jgi:hypothetical protein
MLANPVQGGQPRIGITLRRAMFVIKRCVIGARLDVRGPETKSRPTGVRVRPAVLPGLARPATFPRG